MLFSAENKNQIRREKVPNTYNCEMFLLWLVMLMVVSQCKASTFHVAAVNATSTDCPQPCHSLQYYAHYLSDLCQGESTQLVFMEGEHFLHNKPLTIENTMNVSMVGYSTAIPTLYIANGSFIQVINVTFVTVQNLRIIGTYNYLSLYQTFTIIERYIVKFKGFILAEFKNVEIYKNTVELYGKRLEVYQSSLIRSSFERNHDTHTTTLLYSTQMDYSIIFNYVKGNTTNITLVHCNVTCYPNIPLIEKWIEGKHMHFEMRDTFYRGEIDISVNSKTLKTLTFHVNNCTFESISTQPITKQPVLLELVDISKDSPKTIQMRINDTKFYCKRENFMCINIDVPFASGSKINVSISHSYFMGYDKTLIKATKEHKGNFISPTVLTLQLNKVTVQNVASKNNLPAIKLSNVDQMLLKNSKFIDNTVSVLEAHNSVVAFSGTVVFKNNTGQNGGALSLYNSPLYFYDKSNVYFEGNKATGVGGAIYTKLGDNIEAPCFYIHSSDVHNVNVWFSNNRALMGGHDVFGGYLNNSCRYWEHDSKQCYMYTPGVYDNKAYKFHTGNTLSSPTSVTCNPTRVCLCDEQGVPQCANEAYIHRTLPALYPGETVTVPAVLVGCGFGTVSGIVYSQITGSEQRESLVNLTQEISSLYACTPLNYTLQSPTLGRTIEISMSANLRPHSIKRAECMPNKFYIATYHKDGVIRDKLLHHKVYLYITMDNCPAGFVLRKKPPRVCSCHPRLEERGIKVCTIQNHTGYVHRQGATWVSLTKNKTDFLINQHCPYDYCKLDNISIDLRHPNEQCQNGRWGILCGGCQPNLSLALGSSRCLPCQNKHGALTIGFLIIGILLVIFLKALDMTVSNGTINGLILYANVVWGSKSVMLATKSPHPMLQILRTFIAWLNLDLGIETCFIPGLGAIGKTWLQYVFPAYVWCIAAAIALVSRYSTKASKLFGYNSVPVLATLILLSYAKVLQNIIQSLSLSVLDYPHFLKLVWTLDGNIEYFSTKHALLFIAAAMVLLFLWLPFTLTLLTHQCLRRKSHVKYLNWINRLKPFFDAYLGQFKTKHRYWVGLLLIVRAALLLLLSVTSTHTPRINLLATGFAGVALLTHWAVRGMPYRSKRLALLEMTFILNLVLLSYLKLYTDSDTVADIAVTYTSIGVVFIQFLGIVTYHVIVRIQTFYRQRKRRQVTTTIVKHTELTNLPSTFYREPLLDSTVH